MAVNGDRLGISIRDHMIAISPTSYNFQDTTPAHTGGSGVLDYQEALMKAQGNAITDEFVTYWDQTDSGIYLRLNGRTTGQTAYGGLILGEALNLRNNLQSGSGITLEADGTISTNTPSYENLVTSDNDIPNKKYVDDHGGGTSDHSLLTNRDIAGNHAKLIPATDSATAIQITKADGTTNVLNANTTSGLLSVGTAAYETLVTTDNSIPNKKYVDSAISGISLAHTSLTGLTTTDAGHTQFVMLNGRAGGQTITGGTLTTQTLVLKNNAVDAKIFTIESDGTLSTTTTTYENLVSSNNDIPNKKYVDDHQFDHTSLSGLTTTDAGHTQFALLAGRSGGQTFYGDTDSGGNLTLGSTAHATKGKILLGVSSAFDEANVRLGIGNASPTFALDIVADPALTGGANTANFKNSGDNSAVRSTTINLSHSNSIGAAIRMTRTISVTDGASLGLFTQPAGGTITERLSIASTGIVSVTATTASTTTTTGALLVAGGVGVAGTLTAGGYRSSDGTAGLTASPSFMDYDQILNTIIIKNGLITAWTQI